MTTTKPAGAWEVAQWLVAWFDARATIPNDGIEDRLRTNYFEAGLIDSLGVVELIADTEEHFGIRFSERDFQDRRFATIGGLSELVLELTPAARGG